MYVIVSRACVSRVADITNNLTLPRKLSHYQAICVTLEMSVVKDEFLIRAQLIDCRATALALKKSDNLSIARRQHRSSSWGHDIDGIVYASFPACRRKCVL